MEINWTQSAKNDLKEFKTITKKSDPNEYIKEIFFKKLKLKAFAFAKAFLKWYILLLAPTTSENIYFL